jgi:hypothetical protein
MSYKIISIIPIPSPITNDMPMFMSPFLMASPFAVLVDTAAPEVVVAAEAPDAVFAAETPEPVTVDEAVAVPQSVDNVANSCAQEPPQ